MASPPTFEDVRDAATRLEGIAFRTPVIESHVLNERVGGRVLLKLETLQRTGSFKFRGAFNRISRLDPVEHPGGVVAYSGGNHAQGAAAAAKMMSYRALILMPREAPLAKIEGTRGYGAEVEFYHRERSHLRIARADALARERQAVVVPSYDDSHVIAGQGTVGLELVAQAETMGLAIDRLLVPCSGGGLSSGCALVLRSLSPKTRLLIVEPTEFDDTARSLRAGERLANPPGRESICDALLMSPPGEMTFPILQEVAATGLSVTDEEVAEAVRFAFRTLRLVVEPGGCVGLAAILAGRIDVAGHVTATVLSGSNVDPVQYRDIVFGVHPSALAAASTEIEPALGDEEAHPVATALN